MGGDRHNFLHLDSVYRFKKTVYFSDKEAPVNPGVPAPSPTPSITPTMTPSITPTMTNTPTITPTSSITPTPSTISFDTDAAAYLSDVITSGGTVDATISAATNTLFTSLKSAGLYSKMKVMYPYVGGTAASHSINALLDKTYDIVWYGGMTHGISGSTGNGTNAYGETNFGDNEWTSIADASYGLYFTNGDTAGGFHGERTRNSTFCFVIGTNVGSNYFTQFSRREVGTYTTSSGTTGMFQVNRTGSTTDYQFYRNSTLINNITADLGIPESYGGGIFFNARLGATGVDTKWTNDTMAFAFYGEGITNSEIPTLHNIINTFQTSLGRNTY